MKQILNSLYLILALTLTSCGSFGEGMLAALSGYGSYGGYASSNVFSSVPSGGNMNYLLDPRYAMAQTLAEQQQYNQFFTATTQATAAQVNAEEEQQYQAFCQYNKKSDGSNYTKDEWRAFVGQAIVESKSGSYSSSSTKSTTSRSSKSRNSSSSSSSTQRRCAKLTATDLAHCNGTGVCQLCNGKGRYFDTSFGNSRWVDPCSQCGGKGKCVTCGGKGYRY